jgi:hypothetical protein
MVDMGYRATMVAMDDPKAWWKQSTDFLRSLTMVPEAQANAWLLDRARDHWASTLIARTSMHSLLFTMPGDEHPFDRTVRGLVVSRRVRVPVGWKPQAASDSG